MNERLGEYICLINSRLSELVPPCEFGEDVVHRAMKYCLENGGKRIRPALVLEFCRICGGDVHDAIDFACAIEMVHTYSLIHDDLPCMDDDDLRRGKPSCHKAFGESFALLAGDALLTKAFGVISESEFGKNNPHKAVKAVSYLSGLAGCGGMIGGQVIDLLSENKSICLDSLKTMDSLKTGALIRCCAHFGALVAGADAKKESALVDYAKNIGLAFQITDDILDVIGNEKELGKPIGSDKMSGKSTYVTLLGTDKAREYAEKLTYDAVRAIKIFENESDFLEKFALYLIKRTN